MSLWLPVEAPDRYHGQVRTTDGRSLWVVPRLHRAAGWCAEVRLDHPDGELLERTWTDDRLGAGWLVGERRLEVSRRRAEEAIAACVAHGVATPPAERGLVVLHANQLRRFPATARLDDRPPRHLCSTTWVAPGTYQVTWTTATDAIGRVVLRAAPRTVHVEADAVVHVHDSWLGRVVGGGRAPLPPWHRCPSSSLRWTVDGLAAHGDLRRALRT